MSSQLTPPRSTIADLKGMPSPPPAPQKPNVGRSNLSNQAESQVETPPESEGPYIAAPVGAPCTVNSLDHALACGHKVITGRPEPCASNCNICNSQHANPREVSRSFACLKCIVADQQTKHGQRVESFKKELQAVAKAAKKADPEFWIAGKIEVLAKTWNEISSAETMAEAEKGRFCHPMYVDPQTEGAASCDRRGEAECDGKGTDDHVRTVEMSFVCYLAAEGSIACFVVIGIQLATGMYDVSRKLHVVCRPDHSFSVLQNLCHTRERPLMGLSDLVISDLR